jgi:hypothetical protein
MLPVSPAWPIVIGKDYTTPYVFRPEGPMGGARRKTQRPLIAVLKDGLLDSGRCVVRHLKLSGARQAHESWRGNID